MLVPGTSAESSGDGGATSGWNESGWNASAFRRPPVLGALPDGVEELSITSGPFGLPTPTGGAAAPRRRAGDGLLLCSGDVTGAGGGRRPAGKDPRRRGSRRCTAARGVAAAGTPACRRTHPTR